MGEILTVAPEHWGVRLLLQQTLLMLQLLLQVLDLLGLLQLLQLRVVLLLGEQQLLRALLLRQRRGAWKRSRVPYDWRGWWRRGLLERREYLKRSGPHATAVGARGACSWRRLPKNARQHPVVAHARCRLRTHERRGCLRQPRRGRADASKHSIVSLRLGCRWCCARGAREPCAHSCCWVCHCCGKARASHVWLRRGGGQRCRCSESLRRRADDAAQDAVVAPHQGIMVGIPRRCARRAGSVRDSRSTRCRSGASVGSMCSWRDRAGGGCCLACLLPQDAPHHS